MLNDTRIRTTKPCKKPIKLSDSGGLYLLIAPHGSKLWRLAYRFGGKQKNCNRGLSNVHAESGPRQTRGSKAVARQRHRSFGTTPTRQADQIDRKYI